MLRGAYKARSLAEPLCLVDRQLNSVTVDQQLPRMLGSGDTLAASQGCLAHFPPQTCQYAEVRATVRPRATVIASQGQPQRRVHKLKLTTLVVVLALNVELQPCGRNQAARDTGCSQTKGIVAPAMTSVLVFPCVVIAIAFSFALAGFNLPELKPYLSQHQDAFEAFRQFRYFVLLQRSFEHDPASFWDGDCIYGRMFEVYPEEGCAMGTVLHWSSSSNTIVNRTLYLTAEATEGYPVRNVYTSSPISVRILSQQYLILASEYENCDIIRVPHRDNGCEMWVLLDKINEVHSLCYFIYDMLCGAQKFITYDEEKCRNKTII